MKNLFTTFLLIMTSYMYAQNKDTIYITHDNIKMNQLKEGRSVYLVYFRLSKDANRTRHQFWTREVIKKEINGKSLLEINQSWEDKDTTIHTAYSLLDAKTMGTLEHNIWWRQPTSRAETSFNYSNTKVDLTNNKIEYNNKQLSKNDTGNLYKNIWNGFESAQGKYFLN